MLVDSFTRFLLDVAGLSALKLLATTAAVLVFVFVGSVVILFRTPMFPQDFLARLRVETVVGWVVTADCC